MAQPRLRDCDGTGTGTGTFYYQVAPRTRLLFELVYDDCDYQNQNQGTFGSDQSGKQYLYLTGVTWEATGKTTGVFRIGYRDSNQDIYDFTAKVSMITASTKL